MAAAIGVRSIAVEHHRRCARVPMEPTVRVKLARRHAKPEKNTGMTDFVDNATRSVWMAGIRGRDTRPEITVRRWLHREGLRFRLHVRSLPGTPDIVLPRHHVCVFVNGCFWHHHEGCMHARTPSSRTEFWEAKFRRTRERDELARSALTATGWRVIDIWECGIRDIGFPRLEWLPSEILRGKHIRVQWPRHGRTR